VEEEDEEESEEESESEEEEEDDAVEDESSSDSDSEDEDKKKKKKKKEAEEDSAYVPFTEGARGHVATAKAMIQLESRKEIRRKVMEEFQTCVTLPHVRNPAAPNEERKDWQKRMLADHRVMEMMAGRMQVLVEKGEKARVLKKHCAEMVKEAQVQLLYSTILANQGGKVESSLRFALSGGQWNKKLVKTIEAQTKKVQKLEKAEAASTEKKAEARKGGTAGVRYTFPRSRGLSWRGRGFRARGK